MDAFIAGACHAAIECFDARGPILEVGSYVVGDRRGIKICAIGSALTLRRQAFLDIS